MGRFIEGEGRWPSRGREGRSTEGQIASMRARLVELKEIEHRVHEAPDQQISLTDPDSRAMATNMRGASVVGYNVQAAVDTEHHLIVAHEVTNVVIDRTLLASMAAMAKEAMRTETLEALADRGYYSGDQLLACEEIGVKPYVPKPRTSNARAAGRFDKEDFDYLPEKGAYRYPLGKILSFRSDVYEGKNVGIYFSNECAGCALKSRCTTGKERRVRRWEHEDIVEATRNRLESHPDAMTVRRRTVKHPSARLRPGWATRTFSQRGSRW